MGRRRMGIKPGKPIRFNGRGTINISEDRQTVIIETESDIEIEDERDLQSREHDPAAHTGFPPAD